MADILLTITIPEAKIESLKSILIHSNPDYSSKTNAEIKTAQEDRLLRLYEVYLRGLNGEKLDEDKQTTNKSQINNILRS